jgi:hypothetical protein
VKGALDHWIREAREDLGKRPAPDVDWNAVDEKLFARIDELKKAERARFRIGPRRPWAATGAALAAAIAVVALVFGRPTERAPLAGAPDMRGQETIGSLSDIGPFGRVLLRGAPIQRGTALAVGDELEVRDADAFVESPGKVRLLIERGSRVRVTRRRGPLVVALEEGAIEADVTPVASGEAFAVDVAHARVAVHGTHFRVARLGPRALVDLSEGVVSVGEAPRVGPLFGTLVVAPAHVEFGVSNAVGTLSVTHDPAAVHPRGTWPTTESEPEPASSFGAKSVERMPAPLGPRAIPVSRAPLPSASTGFAALPSSSSMSSMAPPPVSPEEAVTTAVRTCMSERPHADNVTVLFRTTLELDVTDDGVVHGARFNPPVLPDVNECAAPEIYRTRFPHGGAVSIPIEFKN